MIAYGEQSAQKPKHGSAKQASSKHPNQRIPKTTLTEHVSENKKKTPNPESTKDPEFKSVDMSLVNIIS